MNLLRAKNLDVVARLSSYRLRQFSKMWEQPELGDDGFETFHLKRGDKTKSKKFGVDLSTYLAREIKDWANFSSYMNPTEQNIIDIFWRIFGENDDIQAKEAFSFSGYWAMEHNDGNGLAGSQVMFIVDNPLGHRLWAEGGKLRTPKKGEAILLHTNKYHALYPAKGLTADQAATRPLKFVSVAFYGP